MGLINRKVQFGIKVVTVLFLLLALTACNQGGLNPITGSSPNESEVEMTSFNLINQERQKHGLPLLEFDSDVAAVARAHSADMRDRNFYGHVNPDGRNFADRLKRAGISFRTAGENLALMTNMGDPAKVANAEFVKDTAHLANLLDRRFVRVGVGVARAGGKYWITQDFVGN